MRSKNQVLISPLTDIKELRFEDLEFEMKEERPFRDKKIEKIKLRHKRKLRRAIKEINLMGNI